MWWNRVWVPCGDPNIAKPPAREVKIKVQYSRQDNAVVLAVAFGMNGFWLWREISGYEILHPSLREIEVTGVPSIPVAYASFALPAGTADVAIQEVDVPSRVLDGKYSIRPFQEFRFESDLESSSMEDVAYSLEEWHPNSAVEFSSRGRVSLKGLETVGVCISPIRYAPNKKRIMVAQEIRFNLVCISEEDFGAYTDQTWQEFELSLSRKRCEGWRELRSFESCH